LILLNVFVALENLGSLFAVDHYHSDYLIMGGQAAGGYTHLIRLIQPWHCLPYRPQWKWEPLLAGKRKKVTKIVFLLF